MKRYLTILGLLALVAGLQTGCIISDLPFNAPDGTALKMQDNFSQQGADCRTLTNDGGSYVTHDVAYAQQYMCLMNTAAPDPLGQCVSLETKAQADAVWGRTGTGFTVSGYVLYYEIGSDTFGYEWMPAGLPTHGIAAPGYMIRTSIIPDIYPGEQRFSCGSDWPWNFNTGGLPEATDRGSYGGEPSLEFYDKAGGCEFNANGVMKNAGVWFTPATGIYGPGGEPLPTNPYSPINNFKILGWLMVCITGNGGLYETGFMPDLVIKPLEGAEFQYGVPQNFTLKSGEASMRYIVNLDEETGKMTATILAVTVRGKSHTLATPWTLSIGTSGRTFAIDRKNPGFQELRNWAMAEVDLSQPFTLGGEYLPWAGTHIKQEMKIKVGLNGLR